MMAGDRLKRLVRGLRLKVRRRRRRRAPTPPVPVVNHDGVRAADPYAFEAAHRRLAWQFRLSVMVIVALCAVVVIQASSVAELVPCQKVQMGLLRIEPRDDRAVKVDPASLVRVLPITRDTPGFDLMMESFVRRYTRLLLEIDRVSQDDRMREANLYSDADWWKRFIRERKKEIDDAIASGLNRSIVVESADRISMRDGIGRYAVDLVQIDSRDGKTVETKHLRAYVAVTSRPHTVRESEKFENPLGLRVLDLAKKERGNS
ncbi:MAG: VirB8/TrbF family protein [Pseudomonadota bacterium]